MDEINENNEISDNSPSETPDNVLIPEIVEDDPEEGSEEASDEYLPEETGDLIEDAVRFINLTVAKMLVEYALKIGNYLLTRFFNDDIELASSTNRYKNVSFSRLCKRPDIALTRQEMGDMVRVAAQVRFLKLIYIDISRLCYTNQRYLTQLPHSEAKLDLILECLNEPMPTHILYKRVQEIKKSSLSLPEETPQEKIISDYSGIVNRLIEKAVVPDLFSDRDRLYGLESNTRTQLRQTATQWIAGLEAKREKYQSLIDHLDYIATHPNS